MAYIYCSHIFLSKRNLPFQYLIHSLIIIIKLLQTYFPPYIQPVLAWPFVCIQVTVIVPANQVTSTIGTVITVAIILDTPENGIGVILLN